MVDLVSEEETQQVHAPDWAKQDVLLLEEEFDLGKNPDEVTKMVRYRALGY